jgi:hypothetical protein
MKLKLKLKLKTLLASTAIALSATAALAESLKVPNDVSEGHLNLRTGPGVNYALVGAIPAGTTITWPGPATCVPRQDGIRGADWCKINWSGKVGWASRAGLMPVADDGEPPYRQGQPVSPDYELNSAPDLVCGRPVLVQGNEGYDSNPVVRTEVSYSASDHSWRVFHYFANGGVVSRSDQYGVLDMSNANQTEWTGTWRRNNSKVMFGDIRLKNGQPFYYETMYDRSRGGAMEWRSEAACRLTHPQQATLPVPQGTVIERTPPASQPPVVMQQPAPAPQPAPAAPITAPVIVQSPPAQPPVVVVVPGTTYSPTPKQEKEGS